MHSESSRHREKNVLRLILFLSWFECFRDAEIRTYHGIKVTTLTRVYERFYGNTLADISVIFFPVWIVFFEKQRTISAAYVSWFGYFTSKHVSFHGFAGRPQHPENETKYLQKLRVSIQKNSRKCCLKVTPFFKRLFVQNKLRF